MNKPSAREVALVCLKRWEDGTSFAESLVEQEARRANLSPADRHFVQALVYGVIRNLLWLDEVISTLRRPNGGLDNETRRIVRMGLCQLFVMELPEHAAVFETVDLAPKRSRGLVNALLRAALRQKSSLLLKKDNSPLNIRFSMPAWLVKSWVERFGREETKLLLAWNNSTPLLYGRATGDLPETPGLVPLDGCPHWYRIEGELPKELMRQGKFYVADPSTRHAVELLDVHPGDKVLDACAAPGGKSCAIIDAVGGRLRLTATDVTDYRMKTLRENLAKKKADEIIVAEQDWESPDGCPIKYREGFDAVLLDVPCSNTGVIQRRVDVRSRLSPQEIRRLTDLQYRILCNASLAVKPGGRLVYSTCSIEEEEDGLALRRFIDEHPGWEMREERLVLPHKVKSDGAYAALMVRK